MDPETVVSKLDVRLRTPSPRALPEALWQSQTPSNMRELEAQSTLLRTKIRSRLDSSPSSVDSALQRLTKGAEVMMHTAELLREEVALLQKANKAATRRRAYKKKADSHQGGPYNRGRRSYSSTKRGC